MVGTGTTIHRLPRRVLCPRLVLHAAADTQKEGAAAWPARQGELLLLTCCGTIGVMGKHLAGGGHTSRELRSARLLGVQGRGLGVQGRGLQAVQGYGAVALLAAFRVGWWMPGRYRCPGVCYASAWGLGFVMGRCLYPPASSHEQARCREACLYCLSNHQLYRWALTGLSMNMGYRLPVGIHPQQPLVPTLLCCHLRCADTPNFKCDACNPCTRPCRCCHRRASTWAACTAA